MEGLRKLPEGANEVPLSVKYCKYVNVTLHFV